MPSKTKKQAKAMRAAAHSPEIARKMGIAQGLAAEFMRADMSKKREREKKEN